MLRVYLMMRHSVKDRVIRHKARDWQKPVSYIITLLNPTSAMDTFLVGVIISAGISASQQVGVPLAIALALGLFFLTLSVGVEFRKTKLKTWQWLAITGGIALLLLLGAVGAGFFFADTSEATFAVVLAFGAAALIYLIAEELLVETMQAEESIFSTVMLFSGFLVLLALKLPVWENKYQVIRLDFGNDRNMTKNTM